MKTRSDAQKLLEAWVSSDSLRRHCLGVAVCMEAYAKKYLDEGKLAPPNSSTQSILNMKNTKLQTLAQPSGTSNNNPDNKSAQRLGDNSGIIDSWYICGLLHDMDWERFPSLEEHPKPACEELEKQGYPAEIVHAILAHNAYHKMPRESLMAKTLFAVDELSGLIVALARVRPGQFDGMSAKSVKKAMKKKDFAAAINRDDIRLGMQELGLKEDDVSGRDAHFELVIKALSKRPVELGLSQRFSS